jgi:pimeloyl-ACP methyl ester carboxylesterase
MKVVLLHALPLDERMWEPQDEVLADHEVIAPRLYDLGSSTDEWARGVLERAEGGSLAVVGSSMGGYCALAAARQAPERVLGVALVCSRADADAPERRPVRDEWIRIAREEGAEALWRAVRANVFASIPDDVAGRLQRIAVAQDPEDLVRAVEAIRDRPDATDVLRSLQVPFLAVRGEHDPLISEEDARTLAATASRGRAVTIAATGHLPSFERPEAFNPELRRFLEEL